MEMSYKEKKKKKISKITQLLNVNINHYVHIQNGLMGTKEIISNETS